VTVLGPLILDRSTIWTRPNVQPPHPIVAFRLPTAEHCVNITREVAWNFHETLSPGNLHDQLFVTGHPETPMRFLIVRTDIRTAAAEDLAAAWADGGRLRDEKTAPEQRRQTVHAETRDAALVLARALSAVGAVRAGRQRVKVLPIGEPERRTHPEERCERQPGTDPRPHVAQ
jgi:hypothetical protein